MNQIELLSIFNKASRDELTKLPGVGPVLADRLVAARPFETLNGAKKISGVTANLLERLMVDEPEIDLLPPASGQSAHEDQAEGEAPAEVKQPDETGPDETQESEAQTVPTPQVVDEGEGVDDDEDVPAQPNIDESAVDTRLSDFKEALIEKSQALGKGLTELGVNVSKRGQAALETVGDLSEKLEQQTKNRGQFWTMLVSSTITALVAILLTLAVLGAINGSLKFTTASQYATIKREADQITSQVALLQQELDGLRVRVDTLEGLGDRMVTLENAQEQLAANVQAAEQQVADMEAQVADMSDKITQQDERTRRFDTFLKELQMLLGGLFAPQGEIQ